MTMTPAAPAAPALATKTKRAAIYCRVSTSKQEDNYSLGSQLSQCREHAERQGFSVAAGHIYQDVASGFSLDRPQLTMLRAALRRGEIDTVIVNSWDRWASDTKDLYRLYGDLEEGEASLESVTQGVFQDTAMGRGIVNLHTMGREFWLEDHKERTKRGMRERVKSGKPPAGNRPPYGYQWRDAEKSGMVIYEPEAAIVRRIFHELANGTTATALTRAFATEGIAPPGQKPNGVWSSSTIGRIARNDAYRGIAWANKWKPIYKGRKVVKYELASEAERTLLPEGTTPRLVSDELASKAVAMLVHNRTYTKRNREHDGFLVGYGIARCALCGHPLNSIRPKRQRPVYRCRYAYKLATGCERHEGLQILASELDEAAWEHAKLVRANSDYVRQHVVRMAEEDTSADDLARVDKALASIGTQEANISRAIAMVQSSEAIAPLVAQLEQLGKTKAELSAEREALAQQQAMLERSRQTLVSFEQRVQRDIAEVDQLSYQQRREVLESLGVSVKVWPVGYPQRYEISMAFDIDDWFDPAYYVPNEAVEDDIEEQVRSGQAPATVFTSVLPVHMGTPRATCLAAGS
jgi:site-specific DNA recombinase